jgi:hypothetical protein
MSSEQEPNWNDLYKFVSSVVLLLLAIVANSLCVMMMWGWFVVPLGLPAIGAAHSAGLASLVRFVATPGGKKSDEPFAAGMLKAVGTASVVTGIGWIISCFMA